MNSYPRKLAFIRLNGAYALFACACLFILIPMYLYAAQEVALPIWAYCFCLAASRLLYGQAKLYWWASIRARQGANAEDEVGVLLSQLPENWQIKRNMALDGIGDVDFVLSSPDGKVFVVDVKSHGGTVNLQNDQLFRRTRNSDVPFEKDFIKAVNRQAFAVKEKFRCAFVTPVILFTKAQLTFSEPKVRNVYVMRTEQLMHFLSNHVLAKPLPQSCRHETTEPMSSSKVGTVADCLH